MLLCLLSSCRALVIDHVTGCPRSDARFTYDCAAGMLVTITSLNPDFAHWSAVTHWSMQVEQLPLRQQHHTERLPGGLQPARPAGRHDRRRTGARAAAAGPDQHLCLSSLCESGHVLQDLSFKRDLKNGERE